MDTHYHNPKNYLLKMVTSFRDRSCEITRKLFCKTRREEMSMSNKNKVWFRGRGKRNTVIATHMLTHDRNCIGGNVNIPDMKWDHYYCSLSGIIIKSNVIVVNVKWLLINKQFEVTISGFDLLQCAKGLLIFKMELLIYCLKRS